MSQALSDVRPDIRGLITEDDEPVDNFFSEKQQRLLTEPLYSSWAGPGEGRNFLAAANVGIFYLARNPAIVPDVFLSLDVDLAEDWIEREQKSYFLWEFGKPPEVVIEIVSNREGNEDGEKRKTYARLRVEYYAIYDPMDRVMREPLTVYQLRGFEYERLPAADFPSLGLGLALWKGEFEGHHATWLRWVDARGEFIPTGGERAEQEQELAAREKMRAEQERARAEQEKMRAEAAERALREALDQLARLNPGNPAE